ncbi:MAG: type I methionyl aminopeptidase [Bacteroidales bacterium]|nr:type I methionyl aminopeptidase [Bacteroidales bacterium]
MSKKGYAPLLPAELREKINEYRAKGYKIPPLRIIRTEEQIEGIRKSAKINTALLDYVSENIREGMSTAELDKMVYDFTCSHGAIPAPLNYEGFPKSCCISRNEVVCHGIPSEKEFIRDGDIVNVDVSTILDGYYSDASRMFMIGNVSPEKKRLVDVTKECLMIGLETAKPWARLGDVGAAIQEHAERNGYSVVRELCGHGCGIKFHEPPEVLHYGRKGTGELLIPGMTFTIEPMINMGGKEIHILSNEWTIITADIKPSAQWEHQILITETGNEILTY